MITVTAVCDPTPNNTLDTVLSVFLPFDPATNTATAVYSNDDGGPEICGGFRSSRLVFQAPLSGNFTFRVDGFGSATGPYTLTIDTAPGFGNNIPTLNESALILLGLLLAGFGVRRLRERS